MPRLDLGPSESADAAFALVEETAREMEAQFLEVAPTALGKIFKALQRNASKFAQRAGAADDGDTGESLFHSALVNAGCYFFGGEVYNAKAGAATINASPQDVDETDLDLVNSLVHMNPEQIDRAYLELPAEQVVAMASLLRKGAPGVLSYLGLETMSESEVDEVCAVVVPMLVYAVGLFREHLCGPELEALMPALAVMDGGHALSA
jgi:hypothetical protein